MKNLFIALISIILLSATQWFSRDFLFLQYIHIPLMILLLIALSTKGIHTFLLWFVIIIFTSTFGSVSLLTHFIIWTLVYVVFYFVSRYLFSDTTFISIFLLSLFVYLSYFAFLYIALLLRATILDAVITPTLHLGLLSHYAIVITTTSFVSTVVFMIMLKVFKNLNHVFLNKWVFMKYNRLILLTNLKLKQLLVYFCVPFFRAQSFIFLSYSLLYAF